MEQQEIAGQQDRRLSQPATAIIVGAGHRAILYASYAEKHPEQLRIVGVVEPDEVRRKQTAERFALSEDAAYASVEELVATSGKIADAAINGTMDALHVPTTLPLLQAGYDVLLEKPMGINEEEVRELISYARKYDRKVMICHVLRYAPFYSEIYNRIAAGDIGEILNIQMAEHVSYHHMAMGYVRGKWRNLEEGKSSMLMAKCSHDLDLLAWMKGDTIPVKVSSYGGLSYFRPEKAPEGAGTRCLVDCPIEENCIYSAKKHYIEQGLWKAYVSADYHLGVKQTEEELIESLRTDNPYGRCVWKCDNDVVDHQSVMVEFADGSTATHNMVGASSKASRKIHLIGTKGEIHGEMENDYFTIRRPKPERGHEYEEERVEINAGKAFHGGGDLRLVEDFVRVVKGEKASPSSTELESSIYGHLIGFAADRSMETDQAVKIDRA